MNQVVLQSLQQISTGYSVFEKDQVLTHSQLNTVAEYFDDQTRLSRTKLFGVGIVCGLRVSIEGANVKVSKGVGVTTDGDLLYLPADTVFGRYKPYDDSNPTYPPFAGAVKDQKIQEWLPKGETTKEDEVVRLSRPNFGRMLAVLFMEGYIKDEDLCTGTDCDNLGQNFVSTVKLLLVDKDYVSDLNKSIPSAGRAVQMLANVVADRPLFSSALSTPLQLAGTYRAACQSIRRKLAAELPKLFPNCAAFLGDALPSDPAAEWLAKLTKIASAFATPDSGIQYYYDFLKDIVETYNDFRHLLFGDTTWCCPDTDSFPKHLVLGPVVVGADPEENRTGFYPSPLVSRTAEELKHARFLVRKLDTLIQTFRVPPLTGPIRITPSRFREAHLEDRAIPYYYEINAQDPVQEQWSYDLHRKRMDAWNYSYHAASYAAQGGAATPFTTQISSFSFFRIEGCVGLDVTAAKASIEAEIKKSNLPFVVEAVLAGTDKVKVIRDFGIQYTDLHSLHHILRRDVYDQLGDVKNFSADYVEKVKAVDENYVPNPDQLRTIAGQKNQTISRGAGSARAALNQDYVQYKAADWKPAVEETMTAAAEFKLNLGQVTKTEFTTPFDSFIGSSHIQWLDWLDVIIQDKDDKELEKLLYSNYRTAHPGLEHFAGVVPGGTFVLVYDNNHRVIADFMLPYLCCKPAPEVQPREPVLPPPKIKTATALGGITIMPGMDKTAINNLVTGRLTQFTRVVIDPSKLPTAASATDLGADTTRVRSATVSSPLLDAMLAETKAKQRTLDLLKEKAGEGGSANKVRHRLAARTAETETDLGKSIQKVAELVSDAGMDVSHGTEAYDALVAASDSIRKITNARVRRSLKSGLTALQKKTRDAELKKFLRSMMKP